MRMRTAFPLALYSYRAVALNSARALAVACLLLLALSSASIAQSFGPVSITGSGCAAFDVPGKATAALQVTGTWSGTLQPQVSIQGKPGVNTQTTPASSTTAQATITANGAYFSSVSGYSTFQLCGATVTGTAKLYLNLSTAGH